jgi:UDP-N-acetylmuramate dehydrogenase
MDEIHRRSLEEIGGRWIRFHCPMSQYTTFRVGGRVDAIYFTQELSHLKRMVSYLSGEGIPYLVVGRGSNLLVKDGGLQGVVIILQGELATIEQNNRIIVAGGGLSIGKTLSYCKLKGLSGLEFLAGIPGTMGGAVAMNAGAFGKDMGSMVQDIEMITRQGDLVVMDKSQINFSYRTASIPRGAVIVKAGFELSKEDPDTMAERIADYMSRRRAKQPLEYPSGGSIFKNPPNDYAGRLIENAGLKGKRIGKALISPKHANFIVNTGGARAEDILALMDLAREKVREETGIELEPEIKVVGT